jgi:hypothetical protein
MTSLPILERELRVAARRHGTYSMRLLMALGAIALGAFFYSVNISTPSTISGRKIFQAFSVLALIYCLASGRRLTADCLSAEKREGTLGLLFLTDLKGYDIVLGKLAATSVNAFFCLLAIFPVMGVPLIMGGVTNGEFWRMSLVLVNTFLYSLAIGMFASVLSWDARLAMGINLLVLLALTAIPAACAGVLTVAGLQPLFSPLFYSCPLYSLDLVYDTKYKWQPQHFWWSIGVTHALTWGLVVMASKRLPTAWQDRPSRLSENQSRNFSKARGRAAKRAAWRRRLLKVNPFYWLAARSRFKPVGVWFALLFIGLWWVSVRAAFKLNWAEDYFALVTAFVLNSVFKLWIAIEVAQRLADDQKSGALELLLSTPLSVTDIVCGQLLALSRQFLLPLLLVMGLEVFAVNVISQRSFQTGPLVLSFGLHGLFLLCADVLAIIGVGIFFALTARNPNAASVATISRILVLPSILFVAGAFMTLLSGTVFALKSFMLLWFWLGITTDLFFGLPAWWQIVTRFRQLAVQRHTSDRPSAIA